MAYDPNIFSYNALCGFVSALNDSTLTKIFGVVNTKNFELISSNELTFVDYGRVVRDWLASTQPITA